MKKSALSLILLFVVFVPSAWSATHDMPTVGLCIDLPEDYQVRGEAETPDGLLADGASYESEEVSTLLSAVDEGSSSTLTVTATYSPAIRRVLFPSEAEIDSRNDLLIDEIGKEGTGMQLSASGSYRTAFAEYSYLILFLSDFASYSISYTLLLDGCVVNFVFVQETPFEGESLERVQAIMESVKWMEELSSGSVYSDDSIGISFLLPSGYEVVQSESGCCLLYNVAEDAMIQYVGLDAYASLSAFARRYLRRSEFNMSLFSESDLAETLEVPADQISRKRVGGIEYFVVRLPESGMLAYETYLDGYDICFTYTSSASGDDASLEDLLRSVHFR